MIESVVMAVPVGILIKRDNQLKRGKNEAWITGIEKVEVEIMNVVIVNGEKIQ